MRSFLLVAILALVAPAAAGPATCADPCTIDGRSVPGYLPPVVVIQSGTSIVFTAQDTAHVQGDVGFEDGCFAVGASPFDPAPPVRFDIVDGGLFATALDFEGHLSTRACGNAEEAAGAFTLPYHCLLHPTMVGTIVVD